MNTKVISNRTHYDSLSVAVRRALRLGTGVIATGLAFAAVFTASAAAFPGSISLVSLLPAGGGDGSTGFVLNGVRVGGYAATVSSAGDVNGDGIDDLIIGAGRADPAGRDNAGESYVVFGRDTAQSGNFPAVFELASLLPVSGGDGSTGFVIDGATSDDFAGGSVSAAGDVNGDGIDDLLIGAPFASPGGNDDAGESFVVFGRDTAQTGTFPALFQLAGLFPGAGGDGSAGFVIAGIDANDHSASSLRAAGDVDGDGIDDLIIGAYGAQRGAGESYVVFGRNGAQRFPPVFRLSSLLPASGGDGSAGFVISGIDRNDRSGIVSGAGDVNGDGVDDLIIGAIGADPGGQGYAGESYVVFGRDTAQAGNFPAVFPLATLLPGGGGDGSAGFVLTGIDAYDESGAVSGAGDINGDGVDDIVIGAFTADPNGRLYAGESYVVFGRDTASDGNFAAIFPLASLMPGAGGDGSAGFVLAGIDAYDFSGAVGGAGDVNGDGVDDVMIGARFATPPHGQARAGESYVVFGRDTAQAGNFPAVFQLQTLFAGAGSAGFALTGIAEDDRSGAVLGSAGDVNGDGVGDIIIGAYSADPHGRTDAGQSYVVFGRADAP